MIEYDVLLAQQPGQRLLIAVVVVLALLMLALAIAFARLMGPWVQSLLSGAPVSFVELLAMRLRKIPPREIVRLRIMAVQAGVPLTTTQLQSAYLRGADVERAVLTMIRAHETGEEVAWEDLLSADSSQRLDERNTG
jgi:uncharacterized protein YqfA (UPF0365 family)